MSELLTDALHELRKQKSMAERAMGELDDADFFRRPGEQVNPIANIVKHIAGNLRSRWTDFLTTDGEKPNRDRDSEFVIKADDSRSNLMSAWERGWSILFESVTSLREEDLQRIVAIRGEQQTAQQALLRAALHIAYHTGQILYLVRLFKPDSTWLTIPPGQSRGQPGTYRQPNT